MLSAFISLFVKELRQTIRDKRMLATLVVMPFAQLLLLGFAVNLEVDHVKAIIVDEDRTPESRALLNGLTAGDMFVRTGEAASVAEALPALERAEVTMIVVVPDGYADDVDRARPTAVQILVDGGDSNRAAIAQNAVAAYLQQHSLARVERQIAQTAAARGAAPRVPRIRVEPRVLYNSTLDSQIYFVPGVAATLLLIVTLVVTSMGLAREKEMGTLEQVTVTPIRPSMLVLGKTVPYAVIGLFDLGLVIAAGTWIFDVPLRGFLPIVFAAGALYLLAVLGIGLLISTAAKNQQQALIGAFFVLQPAILLSGFITPVENMPAWLQPFTALDPVRHMVEVMRAVLLKGATWSDLAPQFASLAGLGLVIFTLAAISVRRQVS